MSLERSLYKLFKMCLTSLPGPADEKLTLLLIMAEDTYLGAEQQVEWGLSVTVKRLHLNIDI